MASHKRARERTRGKRHLASACSTRIQVSSGGGISVLPSLFVFDKPYPFCLLVSSSFACCAVTRRGRRGKDEKQTGAETETETEKRSGTRRSST